MTIESYEGYTVRGFAKQYSFEEAGAVEKGGRLVEGSDPSGITTRFERATAATLSLALKRCFGRRKSVIFVLRGLRCCMEEHLKT